MEGVASDIKKGKKVKKINKKDIRKLFTKTRWGTNDAEWFDLYNPSGAAKATTAAAGTQAPFRAYDANVDDGLPDYKAKKEAYEKKK